MQSLRAGLKLAAFLCITLPLMAAQFFFLRLRLPQAMTLPRAYHRLMCWLLGVRIHVRGQVAHDKPVLLVANHVSWLDIPVLSTLTAPISFVAKNEVGGWPLVGWLAKLQRTLFVDRARRGVVRETASEIARRLESGDHMVLFAEGTSSDGNQVLPFKSALFAAVEPSVLQSQKGAYVQTLALAYTHLDGLPMGRPKRPSIAWYGDMDMVSHAWGVLKSGPVDVHVRIGEPVSLASFGDRKKLTAYSETRVRRDFAEIMTGRPQRNVA